MVLVALAALQPIHLPCLVAAPCRSQAPPSLTPPHTFTPSPPTVQTRQGMMPGMVPNPGMQQQYPPPAPPLRSQMTSHQQQQPQQPQQMQQQQHMGQPVMGGTMAITGQKRPLDAGSYGGFAQGQVRWVCVGLGQAAGGSWGQAACC